MQHDEIDDVATREVMSMISDEMQESLFVSFPRTKCSHLNMIKNVSLKSGENTKKNTPIILVLYNKGLSSPH